MGGIPQIRAFLRNNPGYQGEALKGLAPDCSSVKPIADRDGCGAALRVPDKPQTLADSRESNGKWKQMKGSGFGNLRPLEHVVQRNKCDFVDSSDGVG
jgi:hypothetical protein